MDVFTIKRRSDVDACTRTYVAVDLGLQAAENAASAKKMAGMRPSKLTIHRTETTRRADFAVHFTRRDRRAP